MLITIFVALAVVIVVFVAVVMTRPSQFQITRSARIAAPPAAVFAQVNELSKWEAWSPWAKLDPNAKHTFDGPAAGTGAKMAWSGNKKVGEGRMTITESRPGDLVRLRLEFIKPFSATNLAEFTFLAQEGQTAVIWSMSGKNNFMAKAFGLFVNFDRMIGGDFEKGLLGLKSVVEVAGKN
jgi:uncharacterized protein YndB with AHSA1/START domain